MNNENIHEQDAEETGAYGAVVSAPEESGAAEVAKSPGEILREQRERRGFSVQQVADRLNLTMHFVRALEADAYDKLPGDVFARGYMRSYSDLLQLDVEKMLTSLNAYIGARESKQQAARHRRAARRRRDRNKPWIIFSGFAFIVVAIALWYFSSPDEESAALTDAAVPVVESRLPRSSPAGTAVAVQPQQPEPVAAAPTNNEAVIAETESGRLISLELAGDDELRVALSASSWVAVDDATETQVFGDMLVGGDVLEIHGTAPFSVLVGDATGAELYFNGQPVDVGPNIRVDNSVRVSLGL